MLILSNRDLVKMPTGEPAYLDLNEFADKLYMRDEMGEWMPANPDVVTSSAITLAFAGYNNPRKVWGDSAITAARFLDSVLRAHGYTSEIAAALWPGRGENILEVIAFHKARENAAESALQYAPFVVELLKRGVRVSVIGHSAGGYLASLLAWHVGKAGQRLHAVILMEAAMRQAELRTEMLAGARAWLNFHSGEDNALEVMQRDFVDEAGGLWAGFKALLRRTNQRREPLVGMHGIQHEDERVINIDLTTVIGDEHSGAHHVPSVAAKVAKVLT